MNKFEQVLKKKEVDIMQGEEFSLQYPEFSDSISEKKSMENGFECYENEEIKISLRYKDIREEDFLSEEYFDFRFFVNTSRSLGKENYYENYHRLTDFVITTNDGKHEFSLTEKTPIVLIKKNSDTKSVEGTAWTRYGMITMGCEPVSPQGVLVLGHELGHMNDEKLVSELDRKEELRMNTFFSGGYTEEVEMEKDAITLRQERYAWAHALVKLRPFFKGLDISEDVLKKFVHNFLLGSYCKEMPDEY